MKKLLLLTILFTGMVSFLQGQVLDSKAIIEKGVKYYENGNYRSAELEFLKVPLWDTNYYFARYELAMTYMADSTKKEQALQTINKSLAIPMNPLEMPLLVMKANTLDMLERTEEAHDLYDRLIQKYPNYHQPVYEKGAAYFRAGKYVQAEEWLKKSILMNPFHFRSHYNLGVVCYQQGRPAESLMALQYALTNTSDPEMGRSALRFMNFIAQADDSVVVKYKNKTVHHKAFDEMDEYIIGRVSLDKKYKLKTEVDDPITRQLQLIYELAAYKEEDDHFFNQVYIPLIEEMWKKDQFNENMLFLFSEYGIKSIDKSASRNKKDIERIKEFYHENTSKLGNTRVLHYTKRKEAENIYLNNGNELIIGRNKLEQNKKEREYVFNGPVELYRNGLLKAKGVFNAQGKKEGNWKYYSPLGFPESEESLTAEAKLKGWAKYYNKLGVVNEEKYYEEGKEGFTKQKIYREGSLSMIRTELKKNEIYEFEHFHPNGKIWSKYTLKGDKPEDEHILYYYDNGRIEQDLWLKNGEKNGEIKQYYKNGVLQSTDHYVQGKLQGQSLSYYANGQVHFDRNFKNDLLDGSFIRYNVFGKKVAEENYVAGKEDGEARYYDPKGNLFATYQFKKGRVLKMEFVDPSLKAQNGGLKEKYFYGDGTLKSELLQNSKGELHGENVYYYPNGKVREKAHYKNGILNGTDLYYYMDGNVYSELTYKDGKAEGFYYRLDKNGDTLLCGNYMNGKKGGLWREFTRGKLENIIVYVDGQNQGPMMFYYPDGQLYKVKYYFEGLLAGAIEYDTLGNVLSSQQFPEGKGVYTTHYLNGKEDFTCGVENGLFQGAAYSKYVHGQTEAEYTYVRNTKQSQTDFYRNGQKREVAEFDEDGNYRNNIEYDRSGFKTYESKRSDTLGYYTKYYYLHGKLRIITPVWDGNENGFEIYFGGSPKDTGACLFYQDDHLLYYTYPDKSGKMVEPIYLPRGNGKVETFYPNGNPCLLFELKDGLTEGSYKYYYSHGILGLEQNFKKGIAVSGSKMYNFEGTLIREISLNEKGYLHGAYKEYDDAGKLIFEAMFKDGFYDGVVKTYHPEWKKMIEIEYKYGKAVKDN